MHSISVNLYKYNGIVPDVKVLSDPNHTKCNWILTKVTVHTLTSLK